MVMDAQKKKFFPFTLSPLSDVVSVTRLGSIPVARVASNDLPLDQQLADAFNANNDVLAYVIGITKTTLPNITPAPSWYNAFELAFADAQSHAYAWYSISTSLTGIPKAIAGYGTVFDISVSTINSLIAVLQANPKNTDAISALKEQFRQLISHLRFYTESTVGVYTSINDFSSNLIADAKILSTTAAESAKDQGVNREQVKKIQADIESMRKQINTWQVVETAAAIAAGVAFFAGAVIAIFSLGFGLAFGIIGAVAGIATTVIADKNIKTLRSQIEADTARMNTLTKQAASLAVLSDQLNILIELSKAAGTQIDLLLQVWDELESDLNTVLTDLENCNDNVDNLNLPALQRNLNLANQDWKTVVGLCNNIAAINYLPAKPLQANIQ